MEHCHGARHLINIIRKTDTGSIAFIGKGKTLASQIHYLILTTAQWGGYRRRQFSNQKSSAVSADFKRLSQAHTANWCTWNENPVPWFFHDSLLFATAREQKKRGDRGVKCAKATGLIPPWLDKQYSLNPFLLAKSCSEPSYGDLISAPGLC